MNFGGRITYTRILRASFAQYPRIMSQPMAMRAMPAMPNQNHQGRKAMIRTTPSSRIRNPSGLYRRHRQYTVAPPLPLRRRGRRVRYHSMR